MNLTRLSKVTAGLLTMFGCVAPMFAANIVSVDMDTIAAGIQPVRVAVPGEKFTVGLILSVDAGGVSSYSISALFDTVELSLDGAPAATDTPPAGMFSFGAPMENNALGRVYSFAAGTLGAGPVSTSFSIGTINFEVKVTAPIPDDVLTDITLGFHNGGIDGFFDNAGGSPGLTFVNGSVTVVPEPTTWVMLLAGTLGLFVFKFRRR